MEDCLRIITLQLTLKEQLVLRSVCREFSQLIIVDGTVVVRRGGTYGFAKSIRLMNSVRVKDEVFAPNLEELNLYHWRKRTLPATLPLDEVHSLCLRSHIDFSPFTNLKKVEIDVSMKDKHGFPFTMEFLPPQVRHLVIRNYHSFMNIPPVYRLEVMAINEETTLHIDPSILVELETDVAVVMCTGSSRGSKILRKVFLGESTRFFSAETPLVMGVTHYRGPALGYTTDVFDRSILEEATFYLGNQITIGAGMWITVRGTYYSISGMRSFSHLRKLSLKMNKGLENRLKFGARFDAPLLEEISIEHHIIGGIIATACPLKRLFISHCSIMEDMEIFELPPKLEMVSLVGYSGTFRPILEATKSIDLLILETTTEPFILNLPMGLEVKKLVITSPNSPVNMPTIRVLFPRMKVVYRS